MTVQQDEPGSLAAGDTAEAGDLSRQDPLIRLLSNTPAMVRYVLAALALTGIGVAIGVLISPAPGTATVRQGLVTWVNEGLPPPAGSGGPAEFLARVGGAGPAQTFQLPDTAIWTTAQNATWQVPGSVPALPSCMIPRVNGRPAPNGFGDVRAPIRFGVVHEQLPDGEVADLVVWVECL